MSARAKFWPAILAAAAVGILASPALAVSSINLSSVDSKTGQATQTATFSIAQINPAPNDDTVVEAGVQTDDKDRRSVRVIVDTGGQYRVTAEVPGVASRSAVIDVQDDAEVDVRFDPATGNFSVSGGTLVSQGPVSPTPDATAVSYGGFDLLFGPRVNATWLNFGGSINRTGLGQDQTFTGDHLVDFFGAGGEVRLRFGGVPGWFAVGGNSQPVNGELIVPAFFENNQNNQNDPSGGVTGEIGSGVRFDMLAGLDVVRYGDLYFSAVGGIAIQEFDIRAFNDESSGGGVPESASISKTVVSPVFGGELRYDLSSATGLPIEVFLGGNATIGSDFDVAFGSSTFPFAYTATIDGGTQWRSVGGILISLQGLLGDKPRQPALINIK